LRTTTFLKIFLFRLVTA